MNKPFTITGIDHPAVAAENVDQLADWYCEDDYRPTGFSCTYPNLMTQEGIRGNIVDQASVLSVVLQPSGGQAIRLTPATRDEIRTIPKWRNNSNTNP